MYDFLPTLSTAFGYFLPQCFIWRFSFGLTSLVRYLTGYLQMKQRISRTNICRSTLYRWIQRLNGLLHFLELTSLLLLSYVSWRENDEVHMYSYASFILFSSSHMLLTLVIDYGWPRLPNTELSNAERYVRSKRLRLILINILSFIASIYLYFRHLQICEPMVYSIHCFFEYVAVLTNILYHGVTMEEWNFKVHLEIHHWNYCEFYYDHPHIPYSYDWHWLYSQLVHQRTFPVTYVFLKYTHVPMWT